MFIYLITLHVACIDLWFKIGFPQTLMHFVDELLNLNNDLYKLG